MADEACPICQKHQRPSHQDLICGNCVNESLELVRNAVIATERTNSELKAAIETVFRECRELRNGLRDPSSHIAASTPPKIQKTSTSTPAEGVKPLALQLQKLDIMNEKLRCAGIERAIESQRKKVALLQKQITQQKEVLRESRTTLVEKRLKIKENYLARHSMLENQTSQLQTVNIKNLAKQVTSLKHARFLVLRLIVLPNWDQHRKKRERLRVFSLPVIRLNHILLPTNRVVHMNEFFENLIRLQVVLVEFFADEEPELKLPYLDELVELLPTSQFYDTVQEQINVQLHRKHEPVTDNEPSPNQKPIPFAERPVELSHDATDKIVIEDNVIRVPVSFKTVNMHRRVSLRSELPTLENRSQERFLATKKDVTPEEVPINSAKQSDSDQHRLRVSLKSKPVVILPHRILRRPISQLRLKELLEFITVVAKILTNFYELFRQVGFLEHRARDSMYDFEAILDRVAELHGRFEKSPENVTSRSSATSLSVFTAGSDSEWEHPSEYASAIEHVPKTPENSKSAATKVFRYIFRSNDVKRVSVYGDISESDTQESTGSTLAGKKAPSLKTVMTNVHRLLAAGGNSQSNTLDGDRASHQATMSLMAQSRAQIDEWAVVSKP